MKNKIDPNRNIFDWYPVSKLYYTYLVDSRAEGIPLQLIAGCLERDGYIETHRVKGAVVRYRELRRCEQKKLFEMLNLAITPLESPTIAFCKKVARWVGIEPKTLLLGILLLLTGGCATLDNPNTLRAAQYLDYSWNRAPAYYPSPGYSMPNPGYYPQQGYPQGLQQPSPRCFDQNGMVTPCGQ